MFLRIILLNFFLLICCNQAQANLPETITTDKLAKLSMHKTWHKLIHYQSSILNASLQSEITSKKFFLSPHGTNSPRLELEATIRALVDSEQGDDSAICRFPARAMWVASMLPSIKKYYTKTACNSLNDYKKEMTAQSISVIYASGYLGNPASMYGHLLLKINSTGNTKLLDNTSNFGAIYPRNESFLRYITLGITGGYQARFATEAFHRHNHIYNETELRDMWEYQLKLSSTEIDFLLMHYWELRSQTFTYYFFKQNCAYQIARLLELVVDRPLMSPNKAWVMPYDIIRGISNDSGKSSLVQQITKHQSRQESFYNKYKLLSHDEQILVKKIIDNKKVINLPVFLQRTLLSQKKITDTLLDYFGFLSIKNGKLSLIQKQTQRQLLLVRFNQSVGKVAWNETTSNPPHQSQYPSLLQISPTFYSEHENSIELRFKANYYDLLSLDAGRMKNTSLSMFDLRLAVTDNSISVAQWDLINIENLNTSQTGLPDDDELSWAVRIGVAPVSNQCDKCLATSVTGAVGKSYASHDDITLYAMLEGKVHAPSRNLGYVKAGIKFGSLISISPSWRMRLDIGYHKYLDDSRHQGNSINWQQRFGKAKSWDIRTNLSYDDAIKAQISYSYYW